MGKRIVYYAKTLALTMLKHYCILTSIVVIEYAQGDVEMQTNRLMKKSRESDEACGDGCVVGGGRFEPKLTYQSVNRSCGEANNTCSHESHFRKRGETTLSLLFNLLA